MKVWMAGAEIVSHRNRFVAEGITDWAINLTAYSAQRQAAEFSSAFDGVDLVGYCASVPKDPSRLSAVLEASGKRLTAFLPASGDQTAYKALGDRWTPLWDGSGDIWDLLDVHERIAVADAQLRDPQARRKAVMAARDRQIIVISSQPETLLEGEWYGAVVSGWLQAQTHGEIQVWADDTVRRRASADVEKAVRTFRREIEALGVDPESLIGEDSADARVTLALRSWQALSRYALPPLVANGGWFERDVLPDLPDPKVANAAFESGHERKRGLLPVLDVVTVRETVPAPANPDGSPMGEDLVVDTQVLAVRSASLRQCNACEIRKACPEYAPNETCAFDIPVSIKTREEMKRALDVLVEVQFKRAMFGVFKEDVEGAYDPVASAEIDRFATLAERARRVTEDVATFRQTTEINVPVGPGNGMVSRYFGPSAGTNAARQAIETTASD